MNTIKSLNTQTLEYSITQLLRMDIKLETQSRNTNITFKSLLVDMNKCGYSAFISSSTSLVASSTN